METYELAGTVRHNDHATSVAAAATVKRVTLRDLVKRHAFGCGMLGLIDDELKALFPGKPESSLRKRRTELTQENWLLDTGRTRKNRFGHEEKVYIHRSFHHSPPPISERQVEESAKTVRLRLEAEIKRLEGILTLHGIEF